MFYLVFVISILYFFLHILSPEFVQRVNRNSRAAINTLAVFKERADVVLRDMT